MLLRFSCVVFPFYVVMYCQLLYWLAPTRPSCHVRCAACRCCASSSHSAALYRACCALRASAAATWLRRRSCAAATNSLCDIVIIHLLPLLCVKEVIYIIAFFEILPLVLIHKYFRFTAIAL